MSRIAMNMPAHMAMNPNQAERETGASLSEAVTVSRLR
jgi:hypothetical protein